jgi:aminopeptidase
MDSRVTEHAKILTNYCTGVKRGDNVLVEIRGDADGLELATEISKEAARVGGHTLIVATPEEAMRTIIDSTPIEELAITSRNWLEVLRASDVDIIILSPANTRALENVDSKRMATHGKAAQPLREEQLKKRWNITVHPTNALAQDAGMSLTEYRDFAYSAMIRDWNAEIDRMKKLKAIMEKASEVQLIGEDTDLSFSMKGRTAVIDDARLNLPGGEVFTAPVDNSATGKIYFDLPAVYGKEVTGVRLRFDKGVIVDYSASKNESFLKEIIETDDGSKRLGEFGIGTNRGINRFTRRILFDEKMVQTVHLAIGNAYKECGGVNKSAVHWDMIKTMKPGKIIMDGEPVQTDGKFIWE